MYVASICNSSHIIWEDLLQIKNQQKYAKLIVIYIDSDYKGADHTGTFMSLKCQRVWHCTVQRVRIRVF